jgi:hypothetical protein
MIEKFYKFFYSKRMSWKLDELSYYFNDQSIDTIDKVFNYFNEDPSIRDTNELACIQGSYPIQFLRQIRRSEYTENTSIVISIPFIINERDTFPKILLFIRGFTNKYEILIKNCATDITAYAISNIHLVDGLWTGQMSIRFDKNRDALAVYNDTKLFTGTNILLLGNAIARLFHVEKITIGDEATVPCILEGTGQIYITLMKRFAGQTGFYERIGFIIPNSAIQLINIIRKITMSNFLTNLNIEESKVLLNKITINFPDLLDKSIGEIYSDYIDHGRSYPKGLCFILAKFTELFSVKLITCNNTNEICDIVRDIYSSVKFQYKLLTQADLEFIFNT